MTDDELRKIEERSVEAGNAIGYLQYADSLDAIERSVRDSLQDTPALVAEVRRLRASEAAALDISKHMLEANKILRDLPFRGAALEALLDDFPIKGLTDEQVSKTNEWAAKLWQAFMGT